MESNARTTNQRVGAAAPGALSVKKREAITFSKRSVTAGMHSAAASSANVQRTAGAKKVIGQRPQAAVSPSRGAARCKISRMRVRPRRDRSKRLEDDVSTDMECIVPRRGRTDKAGQGRGSNSKGQAYATTRSTKNTETGRLNAKQESFALFVIPAVKYRTGGHIGPPLHLELLLAR